MALTRRTRSLQGRSGSRADRQVTVGVEYPPGALWPLRRIERRPPPRRGCRMRQSLISLLGTWWRSNQGELEACRRELSQSLERDTATPQVLGIISSSPSDLQPVFE